MKHTNSSHGPQCQICGCASLSLLRRAELIRPVLRSIIVEDIHHWDDSGWICLDDMQKYQQRYLHELLRQEKGELTELENEVLKDLRDHELTTKNPLKEDDDAAATFGEKIADRMAEFGGSWKFILSFCAVLMLWVVINVVVLASHPFDPYPFILLNLFLSALASVQAPLIMMSQNRQEARDRLRSMNDYQVNLKAELEIRHLHQKIDHLLSRQWDRLLEIQEIQIELIQEMRTRK
ncbi:MAG: DUF1003 domain-containing protein [Akkermansiaceae bacterium]